MIRLQHQNVAIFTPTVILNEPVFVSKPAPINIVSIIRTGLALTINLDHVFVSASEYLILKLSAPLRGSQQSFNYKFRSIFKSVTDSNSFNIAVQYEDVFKRLPVPNDYLNCKVSIGTLAENPIASETQIRVQVG